MRSRHPGEAIPPEALFVLGGISQYIGAAIAVTLFDTFSARNVALLRVLAAGLIVLGVRRSWRKEWNRQRVLNAAVFGSVLAAMNLAFYLAIDNLPLGNAVAIEFLGPISVAALGARSRRSIAAVALAGTGVAVISGVQAAGSLPGIGFALLAAVLWAGYIVLGHRIARSGSGIDGLGLGMAIGALVIAPVAAPGIGATFDEPFLVLLALATGLFSNAIPYGIDQVVMARLPRSRFALLQSLLPLTATIVGFVALGQVLQPIEVVGVAMVVVAIWMGGREAEMSDAVSSGVHG